MRPFLGSLLHALRHAAVGVAVVCVLMMSLRVHAHAHTDDGHGHGTELSLGTPPDGEPDAPADPDGCGHCHCPPSSVMIAETPALAFQDQVTGLARLAHPAAVPDSLSYPPDPPPVRLT